MEAYKDTCSLVAHLEMIATAGFRRMQPTLEEAIQMKKDLADLVTHVNSHSPNKTCENCSRTEKDDVAGS
jgi:F0F1-type ATP synthase gamma subunit